MSQEQNLGWDRIIRDLSGQKFHKLLVIKFYSFIRNYSMWQCQCDCGKICVVRGSALTRFKRGTKSCGCLHNTTHRKSKSPLYQVWRGMRNRCCKPNDENYKNYGGRGITICDEWKVSFENFWNDMSASYQRGKSIDRINNNGGYSKENCRWATPKEQRLNSRSLRIISTPLGDMPVSEASKKFGILDATLRSRIKRGWTPDELFTPIQIQQN